MNASSQLVVRPPIVAVLGHVDHGKSTLLDFIRHTNIVASEAGGITQHVAAYEVEHEYEGAPRRITFIDTPGHAAFQAIRSRGAKAADIAILVVAADDGVKAQTLEALASIRASQTPFVVAINKIDKPNADLSRTQASLLENGVFLEHLGGDVPWVAISAKTGQGVDQLLDLILLVAEMQQLTADPHAPGSGYVVEAHRDSRRGIAATLIIRNGTIQSGTFVRAGRGIAPVRIMEDHMGRSLRQASCSSPVTLVGFDEMPDVGAEFYTYTTRRDAEEAREKDMAHTAPTSHAVSTDDGKFRLPVIIRADTQGSLDAILSELPKIGTEFTAIGLIHAGIGDITEGDVKAALAAAHAAKNISSAIIIGFNVEIERIAESFAAERGVLIEKFTIIYKLTERLAELLKASAPKRTLEKMVGTAKIIKVFSSKSDEHLIGASMLSGTITAGADIRVSRRGEHVGRGVVTSLQRNRQTVARIEGSGEFGAQVSLDIKPLAGDTLECIEETITV